MLRELFFEMIKQNRVCWNSSSDRHVSIKLLVINFCFSGPLGLSLGCPVLTRKMCSPKDTTSATTTFSLSILSVGWCQSRKNSCTSKTKFSIYFARDVFSCYKTVLDCRMFLRDRECVCVCIHVHT